MARSKHITIRAGRPSIIEGWILGPLNTAGEAPSHIKENKSEKKDRKDRGNHDSKGWWHWLPFRAGHQLICRLFSKVTRSRGKNDRALKRSKFLPELLFLQILPVDSTFSDSQSFHGRGELRTRVGESKREYEWGEAWLHKHPPGLSMKPLVSPGVPATL